MKKTLLTLAILLTAISASAENYILYTSVEGELVEPKEYTSDGKSVFGARIVSNTYEDGQGKILFDGEVTKIGNNAFSDLNALTSIEIPSSVTTIGEWAFNGCYFLTSFRIPNSVTTIGRSAFYGCNRLESVEISNSLTTIESWAFSHCSALKSVEIPSSVTAIGYNAFSSCPSMESFSGKFATADNRGIAIDGELLSFARAGLTAYAIPDNVTSIGTAVFYQCSDLTSIEIPSSVKKIGLMAFEGCTNLASIKIPDSVTTLGDSAFFECFNLATVELSKSITKIGEYTFYRCSQLASIEIPNGVTEIGEHAFDGCSMQETVVIPKSVTKIGNEAFGYGYMKEIISLNPTPPTATYIVSFRRAPSIKLKVPAQAIEAYMAAEGWSDFGTIVGLTDEEIEAITSGIPTITQNPELKTTNLYNLQGQRVRGDYRGIVIRDGKKYLQR